MSVMLTNRQGYGFQPPPGSIGSVGSSPWLSIRGPSLLLQRLSRPALSVGIPAASNFLRTAVK